VKTKLVPSGWIEKEGRRLDCGPYLSGAIEAKLLLEKLAVPKDQLHDLARGHNGGIYNGPQFVRNYVDDSAYGVAFLTSSSMLLADISRVDLLRKRDALSPRLAFLCLKPGMTLISCSGTIGRMVYARPDMEGVWSSQDILKVVPDDGKILPGYLYAFLASRYGVPMVVGGTYGAIIQHIEPEHIWNLPVPRLGPAHEKSVHELVNSAAEMRSLSRRITMGATADLYNAFGLTSPLTLKNPMRFSSFLTHSSKLGRLDAHFHTPACQQAATELSSCCSSNRGLSETSRVFTPGIFRRIRVEDPQYGYPYYSGSELFEIVPQPRGFLSKKSANIRDYLVRENWLLIQDAGQLGGLIGQITRVRPTSDSSVVSNHLMRVVPHDPRDTDFVYLLLNSQHGHLAILRHAFGTSIPQLDPGKVGNGVRIPWPEEHLRWKLGAPILEAWQLLDEADRKEAEAIEMVEKVIGEGC
jgi:type I restriction enzyme S subunit